jgi:hypothetical protein
MSIGRDGQKLLVTKILAEQQRSADWVSLQLVGVTDRQKINDTIKQYTNVEPTSEEVDKILQGCLCQWRY